MKRTLGLSGGHAGGGRKPPAPGRCAPPLSTMPFIVSTEQCSFLCTVLTHLNGYATQKSQRKHSCARVYCYGWDATPQYSWGSFISPIVHFPGVIQLMAKRCRSERVGKRSQQKETKNMPTPDIYKCGSKRNLGKVGCHMRALMQDDAMDCVPR